MVDAFTHLPVLTCGFLISLLLLEWDCFTVFCSFLLYHEVEHLCVHAYSLLPGPPSHPLGFLFRKEHSLFIVDNPEVTRHLKNGSCAHNPPSQGRPRVWVAVLIPRASPIRGACLDGRERLFRIPARNTLFSCPKALLVPRK